MDYTPKQIAKRIRRTGETIVREEDMTKRELLQKLNKLECGNLSIVVRGERVIADISDVYIDSDHGDDSEFISIDLENET